jgi:hypothetical protein
MKKNGDAYGDFEGRMYPFATISSRNFLSAVSSSLVMGYTLQSNASGAPGLRLIVWSHSLDGGNLSAASLLNNRPNSWYSGGSSVLVCCSPACIASSVATPRIVHSDSSCLIMDCLVSSVNAVAMTGRFQVMCGLIDEMTIGRMRSSTTALLQLNFGSYVASQGYPRSTSSCPISITRKHISL